MNKYKILAIFVATVTVSGCTGFFSGKSNAPTPAPIDASVNNSSVRTLWTASGLGSSQKTGLRFTVANNGNTLYVANANGAVSSIDANSGKKNWSTKHGKLYTGVATNGSLVYVGNQNGQLVALNSSDGQEAWKVNLYGAPTTPPVIAGDQVIIRTIGGAVESYMAHSGDESWAYMVQVPDVSLRGGAAPVVVDNNLLVPTDLGLVGYLRADSGAVLWGQSLSRPRNASAMGLISDIDAEPVIVNNIAYVPIARTGVAAVSLKNGIKLWETQSGVYAGLVADGSSLYVSYDDGSVKALSQKNGQVEWENNSLAYRGLTTPVLINGRIVVGDFEGYVHVLDQTTGNLIGSTKVGKSGAFMPDVLNLGGSAVFQDYAGNLYRITI